jgi:flagellar motility protein MotE (MotC chaperone)
MRPLIKDVPILKEILPPDPEAEGSDQPEEDPKYRYDSVEDAVEYIKQLEQELAAAQEGNAAVDTKVAELEAEVAKLRVYEEQQAEFEKEKQKFYEEVVFSENAPDIKEYIEYYESIDPLNAEALYREAVRQNAISKEMEDYVARYSAMAPKNAAAIFDSMTNDLALVAEILANMDNQTASDILAKMSTENAAMLTEILYPD